MIKVDRMPLVQAKILLRLWNDPNKFVFAEGREEGGSIKELNKKGIVVAAGKVGRKIRWKLVEGALTAKDILLIKKLLSLEESDYSLELGTNGFERLSGTLNRECIFVAKKENFVAFFVFKVGPLDWEIKQLSNDILVPIARKVVKDFIDRNLVNNEDGLTFRYENEQFVRVSNSEGWIKS